MPFFPGLAAAVTSSVLLAHVSFLSSDLLEGRKSPSRGLDVAASYIEAQFRANGLTPIVQHGTKGNNVLAIVTGTDPQLKNTYVIVSAHYDHIGIKKDCASGDCINNGANDDASGVASMLSIMADLAKSPPKRSVIFAAWYGEELGLFGSQFYVEHPIVATSQTIAMLNLEQMGRTDDSERGPQLQRVGMTGYGYTTLGATMHDAAAKSGVDVHPSVDGKADARDEYFERSDNDPFAKAGIPAHTFVVTYEFPDYHKVGDEWQKLDYDNMTSVTNALEAGIRAVADSGEAPKWLIRPEELPKASHPKSSNSPTSPSDKTAPPSTE